MLVARFSLALHLHLWTHYQHDMHGFLYQFLLFFTFKVSKVTKYTLVMRLGCMLDGSYVYFPF